jgi:hypothetical protein
MSKFNVMFLEVFFEHGRMDVTQLRHSSQTRNTYADYYSVICRECLAAAPLSGIVMLIGSQARVSIFRLNETAAKKQFGIGISPRQRLGTEYIQIGLDMQAGFDLNVGTGTALRPDLANDSNDMRTRHAGTTGVTVKARGVAFAAQLGDGTPDIDTRCSNIHLVIVIREPSPVSKSRW